MIDKTAFKETTGHIHTTSYSSIRLNEVVIYDYSVQQNNMSVQKGRVKAKDNKANNLVCRRGQIWMHGQSRNFLYRVSANIIVEFLDLSVFTFKCT